MAEEPNALTPQNPTEEASPKTTARPRSANLASARAAKQETTLEPTPEAAPEPAATEAPADTGDKQSTLAALADSALRGRLSNPDEEKVTRLAKDCLLGTEGEIATAIDALPKLPWMLAVRAVEQAWPGLAAECRTQLLAGLGKVESDAGYRIRLSVARALAKLDMPVAVKLAGSVCYEMWDKEKGLLIPERSKLIGNVFIGRGKPWVLQFPLADLPEAEAEAVVASVIFSAFNINNPPITQLSILRYSAERLGTMHENLLAMVIKSVARWNPKWQDSLRKEVANLPEAILAVLKAERPPEQRNQRPQKAPAAAPAAPAEEEPELPLPPELEEKLKLAAENEDPAAVEAVTQEIAAWRETQRAERQQAAPPAAKPPEERDARGRRGRERNDRTNEKSERPERNERPERAEKKERPAYVSREQEARGAAPFSLGQTLRQIDNYVQSLRDELSATQTKLRRAEEDSRRGRRVATDRPASTEDTTLSPEELKRLTVQLEQRDSELKTRVEELLADSEARAICMAPSADGTTPDPLTQLRTLLALKLKDDYADYVALEKGVPDLIVQQHYRTLVHHVFSTLVEEGIALAPIADLPPPPPAPMPPLPPAPVIDEDEDNDADDLNIPDAEPEPEPTEEELVENEEPLEEEPSQDDPSEPTEQAEPPAEDRFIERHEQDELPIIEAAPPEVEKVKK